MLWVEVTDKVTSRDALCVSDMDWDCASVPVDDCVLVAVKDGEDDPVAVTVIVSQTAKM